MKTYIENLILNILSRKSSVIMLVVGLTLSSLFFLFGINDLQNNYFSSVDDNIEKQWVDFQILYKDTKYSDEIISKLGSLKNSYIALSEIGVDFKDRRIMLVPMITNNNYQYPLIYGKSYDLNYMIENNGINIGKNLDQYTYLKDNKKYIDILGKEYLVLSVIGRKTSMSKHDNILYIPFNILPTDKKDLIFNNIALVFKIGAVDEIDYNEVNGFRKYLEGYPDISIKSDIKNAPGNILQFISRSKRAMELILKIWIIAFISMFLAIYFWIGDRRKDIALRSALGASNAKLFKMILGEVFILNVISFLISIFLYPLFSKSSNYLFLTSLGLNSINLIITFIICLLTVLIISIIATYLILRIDIARVLKE